VVNAILAAEARVGPRTVLADPVLNDEVERDLLQARALVDSAMFNHRQRSAARPLMELPPDGETTRTTLRRLVTTAREELMCVTLATRRCGEQWYEALPEMGRLATAGISVRMLCSPETVPTVDRVRFLDQAQALGIHVRVAKMLPQELVIVDGRKALVRGNVGSADQQVLIARAPAIVGALRTLFISSFDSALPAADYRRLGDREWDDLTRQVLAFLSTGHKDSVAARELGMSVRTYRRYVAVIMRDTGAGSRFQAGVRAAELGLLPGRIIRTAAAASHPTMPPSTRNTAPVI
jgi:hypothetical protein